MTDKYEAKARELREDCNWIQDDSPCADGPLRFAFPADLDPYEFSPLRMCPAHADRIDEATGGQPSSAEGEKNGL